MEKDKNSSSVEKTISIEKNRFLSYCLSIGVILIGWFGNKTVEILQEINNKISTVSSSQAADHQQLIDQGNEINDLKDLQKILSEGEKKDEVSIPNRKKFYNEHF